MLRLLTVLVLMFPSLAYGYECSREIDRISKEIQIPIYCNVYSMPFIPSTIDGTTPNQSLINEFEYSFTNFIATYNKEFLKKFASSMNFLHNLKYEGQNVGGLSNGRYVFINLKSYDSDYVNTFYARALNHELSSGVYRSLSYKETQEWISISNSYDFSSDYLNKCLNGTTFYRQASEIILGKGFLSNYGLTCPENDFNVYAERLFGRDEDLKVWIKKYPKVKIKIDLMKKIYRKAGFTGKFPDET